MSRPGKYRIVIAAAAAFLVSPEPALAYIGPGAGVAVLSGGLVLIGALALAIGIALLMQTFGLSPALGTFLAGVVLAVAVVVHLAGIIAAQQGGLTAAEIISRVGGNGGWAAFYGVFVVAAAVHAPIGPGDLKPARSRIQGNTRVGPAL